MINKLRKPKAPTTPSANAVYHVVFQGDGQQVTEVDVSLENALSRIAEELRTLRAAVAAGTDTRGSGTLDGLIADARQELSIKGAAWVKSQQQLDAHAVEAGEVDQADKGNRRAYSLVRRLLDERQRREVADEAFAALAVIQKAIA